MNIELPEVRVAGPEDIPEILAMGWELHRENALMPVSGPRLQVAVEKALARDHAMIGVIGKTGSIEAMIYLTIGQFWYTDIPHVEELYAFVKPEFRRSNNAKALIEFAKGAAVRLNCPLLIGVISNVKTEAKIRLYERRLGKPAGAYFLFNGTTGHIK